MRPQRPTLRSALPFAEGARGFDSPQSPAPQSRAWGGYGSPYTPSYGGSPAGYGSSYGGSPSRGFAEYAEPRPYASPLPYNTYSPGYHQRPSSSRHRGMRKAWSSAKSICAEGAAKTLEVSSKVWTWTRRKLIP